MKIGAEIKLAAMNRKYIYNTYIFGCMPDVNEISINQSMVYLLTQLK